MNKKYIALLTVLFLFCILPAQAQTGTPFTVYGQVFDTDNTPLNGVTVSLSVNGETISTVTTNATGTNTPGYFYFPQPPGNANAGTSMTLAASISGKSASQTVARGPPESDPQRVDLHLSIGGSSSSSGSSSGGTSSGGGGGGGTTGEEYSNIQTRESRDEMVAAGLPVKYSFTTASSPVNEIVITSNVNAGLINTQIEVLKDRSSLIKENAPGSIYKYLNIWVGTSGFSTSKNIKDATIKFKVETSWIDSNNFKDTDVALMRWDGTKWSPLETQVTTKDSKYTYFESKTNAFSPFAITSLKGTAIETPTPSVTETTAIPTIPPTASQPTPVPTKKTSGFEVILSVVAVSVIFAVWRNRR